MARLGQIVIILTVATLLMGLGNAVADAFDASRIFTIAIGGVVGILFSSFADATGAFYKTNYQQRHD